MELFSDKTDLSCMTVGCIAGWTVFDKITSVLFATDVFEVARGLLEITEDQALKSQ